MCELSIYVRVHDCCTYVCIYMHYHNCQFHNMYLILSTMSLVYDVFNPQCYDSARCPLL